MTAAPRGFRVSILGVRLVVLCDSVSLADTVDRYVLPWLPREPLDGDRAHRRVEVRQARDGTRVEVLVDGVLADVAASPLAAASLVQRALDETLIREQTEVAVIHGGVVGHAGRTILLPAPTGGGKSTLVTELVRRGAAYFSDEYALVDAAGRVHPYPRALLLRDTPGGDRPVLATDLGGSVAREPARAALILGLNYRADATFAVRPLSQGDGVLLLLRNTPQALADQPWILAPLQRVVAAAACYAGQRGEAGEAAAAILRLAASHP